MNNEFGQSAVISLEDDRIDVNGLEPMIEFVHYDRYNPEVFMDGLSLAEDLTNRFGTVLYSSGTEITPQRIARLIELRNANTSLELTFKLARSAVLVRRFREELKQDIMQLFDRHKRESVTSEIIGNIALNMDRFVDELLGDEHVTCLLYQMRFICKSSHENKSEKFRNHPINVALISLAIASSEEYGAVYRRSKTRLVELCRLALFHNYGAVQRIDTVLAASDEKRYELYWNMNREGLEARKALPLTAEAREILSTLCDYHQGDRRCVEGSGWVCDAANILIVADMFLSLEYGLFRDPLSVRKVADLLNVRVAEGVLEPKAVKALTLGLNFVDLFDFYQEIGKLVALCPYGSAVPYPLVGFMSPTIFVCRKEVTKCRYIEGAIKAVNLLRDLGELKKGQYRRCWLLTPRLINFYRKHYRSIKTSVVNTKEETERQ